MPKQPLAVAAAVFALSVGLPAYAYAQFRLTPGDGITAPAVRRPLAALRAERLPVVDALNRVQDQTGFTITLAEKSDWEGQKVNVWFEDQTPEDAARLVVSAAGPRRTDVVPRLQRLGPKAIRIVNEKVDAHGLPTTPVTADFKHVPLLSALGVLMKDYAYRVSFDGFTQQASAINVTYSCKNVPLSQAIREIVAVIPQDGQRAVGYQANAGNLLLFRTYDPASLDEFPDAPVNVEINSMPAREALELVLKAAGVSGQITTDVEGAVTYSCRDKSAREVLRDILSLLPPGQCLRLWYTPPARTPENQGRLTVTRVVPDGEQMTRVSRAIPWTPNSRPPIEPVIDAP